MRALILLLLLTPTMFLLTGFIRKSNFHPSIIIGTLDWKEVSLLAHDSPEYTVAKSVGVLYFNNQKTMCNAWVIGPNEIITNYHCVQDESQLKNSRLELDPEVVMDCSKILKKSWQHDFTVIQCGTITENSKPLALMSFRGERAAYIITNNCDFISNPTCKVKKMYAECKAKKVSNELIHDCDTLPGSSGSPILDRDSGRVLGIHHSGDEERQKNHATPSEFLGLSKWNFKERELAERRERFQWSQ